MNKIVKNKQIQSGVRKELPCHEMNFHKVNLYAIGS